MRVGFGTSTTDPDLVWVGVERILLSAASPVWKVEDLQGRDIAVIELAEEVAGPVFGTPRQHPPPEPGDTLTLIGFGEDRYGLVGQRHAVEVTATGQTDGGFTYTGGGCLGDSGGPLLTQDGDLIGIVSLGTTTLCTPNVERIGQALAPHADFIIETMLRPGNYN